MKRSLNPDPSSLTMSTTPTTTAAAVMTWGAAKKQKLLAAASSSLIENIQASQNNKPLEICFILKFFQHPDIPQLHDLDSLNGSKKKFKMKKIIYTPKDMPLFLSHFTKESLINIAFENRVKQNQSLFRGWDILEQDRMNKQQQQQTSAGEDKSISITLEAETYPIYIVKYFIEILRQGTDKKISKLLEQRWNDKILLIKLADFLCVKFTV